MLKIFVALFTLYTSTFALEISLNGAKENFKKYSTLHLKDKNKFLCQENIDDFGVVQEVICAFPKRPSSKMRIIQNDFFKITNKTNKDTFFIIIKPFKKLKLFPIIFDLTNENTIFNAKANFAKHWMIVGYDDKIPFLKKDDLTDVSINFPFFMNSKTLPYIGGLDIKGNPIHVEEVKDVNAFLKIKRLFKEKKYDSCLELIQDVQSRSPNSIFNVELLYYKIKTYSKLKNNDKVVELAKIYLREYSSDENIAEILSLLGRSYSLLGMNTDADYFFDRLFSEHQDSEFMNLAKIYKGNMLDDSGDPKKAVKYYKQALNNTSKIDIAAYAAYELANNLISRSKRKEAAKYTMKIVKAKPDYFMTNLKESKSMMDSFISWNNYNVAASIAKCILNNMSPKNDNYEKILRDRAIWLTKTKNKKEALRAINRYIKEFNDGIYINEISVAKDSLFFDTIDTNATKRLEQYNKLIVNYDGDSIGNKAIYEKAKLLLKDKKYNDVLKFKEDILSLDNDTYKDTHNIIKDAAIGLMKNSLEKKECHEVLNISNDYNITLSNKWDDSLYKCAMKGGDYQLSKKISSSNLDSKDLAERKKWLYRYIKVDFATGNYSDVIKAAKELITLIKDDKNSKYLAIYRIIFDTYDRVENQEKMIASILNVEEKFGLSYKDIDRYADVMSVGSDMNDDNIVIKYGQKIMKIQNNSHSYPQSPFVEFTLYQVYTKKEQYNTALSIILSLDKLKLKPAIRARQKYLLGTVYTKLWRDEEAKKAYNEVIKIDPKSPWAKLSKSAMEL